MISHSIEQGPRPILKLMAALVMLYLSPAALAEDPPFRLEEKAKATTLTTSPLPAGARLTFSSRNMKPREVLVLQRCGTPCNTAKLVDRWQPTDFADGQRQEIILVEDGRYYFWIVHQLENGEIGPVFGVQSSYADGAVTIEYTSGTTVHVLVERSPPPEPATPPQSTST